MRILIALPLLAVGACQVTEDSANDQVTMEYNQDLAENAAADVANGAKEAGEAIANSAKDAGAALQNIDVDVDVGTNGANDSQAANSN